MEVSDLALPLVRFIMRQPPQRPLDGRLSGPLTQYERGGEEKNSFPFREPNYVVQSTAYNSPD
jgi:hypothetical protein